MNRLKHSFPDLIELQARFRQSFPVLVDLQVQQTADGKLTVLEALSSAGFLFKRLYILSHIGEGVVRGHHAHKNLYQAIIPLGGSFEIMLKGKGVAQEFALRPEMNKVLIVPPGYWRELYNFSAGAICLVAASEEYDEADYIRNYDDFLAWEKNRD